jgi:uncharacterized membrane protein YhaH (DUF805 family)
MDTNRFAPPGAQVDDVLPTSEGFQPVRLWPPRGRIGRLRFFAYGIGLYFLFSIGMAVLLPLVGSASNRSLAVPLVAFAAYLFFGTLLMIQRSHDMDMSGWWSIAAMIPLVGLFWLFKGGTRGANRWGAPPPPNGWGVVIIGSILPLIMVIGIVAAIALPAYQQYTLRAKAAASH